ncbi:MAG: C4-dicarboxylate ABC transporter substrate-binding protein, partial [Halomonas sp.]
MNIRTIFLGATTLSIAIGTQPAFSNDDWPNSMTLGTASQGGAYYVYGSGWANLVNETLDTRIGSEITAGPVQNATFVQTGEHDFGMVTMGPA